MFVVRTFKNIHWEHVEIDCLFVCFCLFVFLFLFVLFLFVLFLFFVFVFFVFVCLFFGDSVYWFM